MPERRPRIAIVTDAIGPFHHGGKEQRYLALAPRLARQAEVHVYTMKWWDGPSTRSADGVVYHAISPLIPLYSGGRRSIRQAVFFSIACLRLLFARFDVIEADHMPYFQLITLKFVALVRRRRLIVTWHEYWGFDYWRTYLGGAGGTLGGVIESIATRLPDGIIAASPQTAERLRAVVSPRIPIITAPNGVDLMGIRSIEAAEDRADVVVVGRLLPHKRVDLLIDAVALLRDRGVSVSARVIGNGPEAENLRSLRDELGLSDQVHFEASVSDQHDLFAMIKSARVAVFPSEREGFGIAVLEALACGVPVITTSAPDNLARFLVSRSEGSGTVCPPDAPALADAISAVLESDATAAVPALDWLAEYDWSAIAADVSATLLPEHPVRRVPAHPALSQSQ